VRAHVGLPTDAGYAWAGAGAGAAAYAGGHQTAPVSGSVYAARGAAVRNSTAAQTVRCGLVMERTPARGTRRVGGGAGVGSSHIPSVGGLVRLGCGTQPIYYDYGISDLPGNQVCFDDQPVAPRTNTTSRHPTLAQSQPARTPTREWMPWGLRPGDGRPDRSATTHAIGAQQIRRPLPATTRTSSAEPRSRSRGRGQQTQRLVWTVGNNKTTVGETGIYNLTKDEAPALIHIGRNKTSNGRWCRLKQPQQQDSQAVTSIVPGRCGTIAATASMREPS